MLDFTSLDAREEIPNLQVPQNTRLPNLCKVQAREMTFWCFLWKSEVVVGQPFVIFSPAYPIAKPFPIFPIIFPGSPQTLIDALLHAPFPIFPILFPGSPQTLIDALLHAKAEAPIAVFYPKLVNGTQVLAGEFFYTYFIQPSFFLPTRHLQHHSRGFLIGFFPLFRRQ